MSVFRCKLKRGRGGVDAVVAAAPGAEQNFAHLTRVAAGDIDKGEGGGDSAERVVQKVTSRSMRECVGVHELPRHSIPASGASKRTRDYGPLLGIGG
jgi:hypothetical protein